MRQILLGSLLVAMMSCLAIGMARADFTITSAIVEFTADGPRQQDVELVSKSNDKDYIETEISEILHPGQRDETRRVIDDPSEGSLLVTPDKTVLAGGGRKVIRFVLLKDPGAEERIYRVAIKPVVKGLQSAGKVGLKILVGYEALVIVRPASPEPSYTASIDRAARSLVITNTGNTNILFQNGKQCAAADACKVMPVARVYAGTTERVPLQGEGRITYSIWDGNSTVEKQFQ